MNTQIHRSNTRFLCGWLIVDNLVVVFVSTLFFFFLTIKLWWTFDCFIFSLYFVTLNDSQCAACFVGHFWFCLIVFFSITWIFPHQNFPERLFFFLVCCCFFVASSSFFSTLCCLSFNFYWFKCVTLFFRIVLFCQFVCTCVLFVRRFVHTQILFRLLFWFNNNLLAVAVARIATILFLSQYLYWRTRWATATNWLRTFFIRSLVYLPSVVFFHQYHQQYHHTDISIHNKFNYDVFT